MGQSHKVHVSPGKVGPHWTAACDDAVKRLNSLFKQSKIAVQLSSGKKQGADDPEITVETDAKLNGMTSGIGRSRIEERSNGKVLVYLSGNVKLPPEVKAQVTYPKYQYRRAGKGVYAFILAHEIVHALGYGKHDSHLMTETVSVDGDPKPAKDKVVHARTNKVLGPPIKLSSDTIKGLRETWKKVK